MIVPAVVQLTGSVNSEEVLNIRKKNVECTGHRE